METKNVFNPNHYGGKDDPYETIKVLEAWLTPDEMIGFCKGNAIKYQSRHRQKGGLEDLSKSLWYQQYLVQYLAARGLSAYGPHTSPAIKSADPSGDKTTVTVGDYVLSTGHKQKSPSPPAADPASAADPSADARDLGVLAIEAALIPADQEKAA